MSLTWCCGPEFSTDNEDELQDQFQAFLLGTGAFNVFKEVDGKVIHRHPEKDEKDVRIDFILTPKPKLIEAGWVSGAIGLELKLERKAGKGISQVLDYRKSVFNLLPANYWIVPNIIAIAPYKAMNEVGSILSQNGCVTASINNNRLRLSDGGTGILLVNGDGSEIKTRQMVSGKKVGSR